MKGKVLFTELKNPSSDDIESLRKFVENQGMLVLFVEENDDSFNKLFIGANQDFYRNVYIFKEGHKGFRRSNVYTIKDKQDSENVIDFVEVDSLSFGIAALDSDLEKGSERADVCEKMLKTIKSRGYNELDLYLAVSNLSTNIPVIKKIINLGGSIGLIDIGNYIRNQSIEYKQQELGLTSRINSIKPEKTFEKYNMCSSAKKLIDLRDKLERIKEAKNTFDNSVIKHYLLIGYNEYASIEAFMDNTVLTSNYAAKQKAC